MRRPCAPLLVFTVLVTAAACGGTTETPARGTATVLIAGKSFDVSNVELTVESGENGYFRIEGDDAANRDKDCVPGLPGRLALYGDLSEEIESPSDLVDKELPFEFSGDGDDANLCFVGSNGLLGVKEGTVRFTSVDGDKVSFTFSGRFIVYDGQGGESSTPVEASGTGTADPVRWRTQPPSGT
jgi:hypothetical protein